MPQKELFFVMDQQQKIGSKRDLQISGLNCKTSNKIAKTIERRASSQGHNPFDERDIVIDSFEL